MKQINFLNKLWKEKKIKLGTPSEEIKKSYIEKSESNLSSAKILFENNKLEEAITLTYYSMYNLVTALLFKIGLKCENHTGTIILLKEIFEIDNSQLIYAKKERVDKQYYTDFKTTEQEVKEAIKEAEEFNNQLFDFISKIDGSQSLRYIDIFKKLTLK